MRNNNLFLLSFENASCGVSFTSEGSGNFLYPHHMNITPQFVKSPSFVKFERLVGAESYKYIVLLGMYCQQSRSPEIVIEEPLDLEIILNTDTNGAGILEALLKFKLIEEVGEHTYSCTFFIDQNKQLLSNWNNGAMKAKKAKEKSQQIEDIRELSASTLEQVNERRANEKLDKFMETDYWKNTLSKCANIDEEVHYG